MTDLESLLPILNPQQGTTFELAEETVSMLNPEKTFLRYEQYFNDMRVEGGGVILQVSSNDDDDPCGAVLFMIAPHIYTNIDIAQTPTVTSSSLSGILTANSVHSHDLIIVPNIDNSCEYNLIWKTEYKKSGEGRLAYVDSQTGEILMDFAGDMHAIAPTKDYGDRDLDDKLINGDLFLESADGRVKTFFFGQGNEPITPIDENEWNNIGVYSEDGNSWGNEKHFYQCHFAMTEALAGIDNFGLTISQVSVAPLKGNVGLSARNKDGSDENHTFVDVQRRSPSYASYGLVDIMGHELAHTFMRTRLGVGIEPNSLNEAICDMFGVFAESIFQGFKDWKVGDDNNTIYNNGGRDLSQPGLNDGVDMSCFEDVVMAGIVGRHARGRPLGHWYYLASGTNGLGLRGTLESVMDALATMTVGTSTDYPELRDAVLSVLESEFGECSRETFYTAKAWSDICVGPDDYNNCVRINGPHTVCEEDNYAHFSVIDPNPNVTYRWHFPFDWTVPCSGNSNSINGSSLTITGFDQESYYPSMQDIQVVNMSSYERTERTLTLRDCDGDDPTCEDVYGFIQQNEEHESISRNEKEIESFQNFVKIYSLSGKLIFTGQYSDFKFSNIALSSQILVIANYDKDGKFINTNKEFFVQ